MKSTEAEAKAERDKARLGRIKLAAQGILQRWVEATPGADAAFVESNASKALATAEALIDATDNMRKEEG